MIKFVIYFMMMLCSFNLVALDNPPSTISTEVFVNQEFSISSRQELPWPCSDDFRWTNDNCWVIESYPPDDIQLISKFSTAPEAFGGDLFQTWKLKGLQAGTFDLTFQLDQERVTITILVVE